MFNPDGGEESMRTRCVFRCRPHNTVSIHHT